MNPRVVAWARARNINPARLVRKSLDDDLFQVDGLPWAKPLWLEQTEPPWRQWAEDAAAVLIGGAR